MNKIPQKTESVFEKKRDRDGMTLIEVMLSAAILAILVVLAVNALFYPRWLVVYSSLEQSAIHNGINNIEQNLQDPPVTNILDDSNYGGNPGEYVEIRTEVRYGHQNEKRVELVTYRSLER